MHIFLPPLQHAHTCACLMGDKTVVFQTSNRLLRRIVFSRTIFEYFFTKEVLPLLLS